MSGKLFLVRHQETDWNQLGLWQGMHDRHLTEHGFEMSERLGEFFKNVQIDQSFTSAQVRTMETLSSILESCNKTNVPTIHADELNERDYGIYTGKNKWEVKKEVGEEIFQKIRRSFDYPIPEGESLQTVYSRVVPFYQNSILPLLNEGKNVLVVAHGNSLRALLKYIENLNNDEIAKLEFDFGTILIYDTNQKGLATDKEIWKLGSRAQILATLGPNVKTVGDVEKMISAGMNAVRLNFSWGTLDEHAEYIRLTRAAAKNLHRDIPIIIDLPGPRIQEIYGHTYNKETVVAITEKDVEFIKFGIDQKVDYFAVSFVGSAQDILYAKKLIQENGGIQKIIAKIERKVALENLDEIIKESDAVMIARGDLGSEVPLEQIPFVEKEIIDKCNAAGKPVITATQMMLSMIENTTPTRAEVTDVSYAILEGSDVVMLSDETAQGKHPLEVIMEMEKIVAEAEKHETGSRKINLLKTLN